MPFLKDRTKTPRSKKLENLAKRNGWRHAIFNVVGDKYTGQWENDFKKGKGVLLTRFRLPQRRQVYEGDFYQGYRHGFGVLAYEKDNKIFYLEYRGGWRYGKMHGFGLRRYRDGGVYIGEWKHGKRDGYGLMWYPDGNFYAGQWIKDLRQGEGMLVKPDINRYEGNWFADMKHGKGRFIHLDSGQLQEGVWRKDICIYSTMVDLKYRQTSMYSTKYAIFELKLEDVQKLCERREKKALEDIVNSCSSLFTVKGKAPSYDVKVIYDEKEKRKNNDYFRNH